MNPMFIRLVQTFSLQPTLFCRERTKKIYTMASRKPVDEVYNIIKSLKVQYFVYEGGWCLRGNAK